MHNNYNLPNLQLCLSFCRTVFLVIIRVTCHPVLQMCSLYLIEQPGCLGRTVGASGPAYPRIICGPQVQHPHDCSPRPSRPRTLFSRWCGAMLNQLESPSSSLGRCLWAWISTPEQPNSISFNVHSFRQNIDAINKQRE